ncbi:hypothetical protein RMS29_027470 (plasmid) [Agrobacterium rosae]|uniref:DUF3617 domain-containing protein n=1 Tax=Agrobacterium rosae TaxID=1972867 RepID=A0AAW9FPS1_9HYPH|nr:MULTISPECIES: hypothetical protein [Agrobacterium]MCF1501587.1 hypothetical protein [Allorhizobium sp. Av2]MDX8321693.1 hypothetical protein [Agrobacterium sp. rho-8.1]MDX8305156.1 hypothetical protein [Agrobacterium rosae]MDX8311440.1 hypothetical protein [Agrobacterium sp. rho-13.3]MDX8316328.1 hypothetical protein [Agrobacterium rosae]
MRSGIKLAVAVVGMGPSLFSMTGLAEASRNVPWADGYYTPRDQAASCKDPNFEVYDWVLRFQKKGRAEMGTSEGVCTVSNFKSKGGGRYESQLDCDSQGEKSTSRMSFRTDSAMKIIEIDGQPYAYCAPLK